MKDTLDHPLFEQIRDLIHSTRTLAVRAVNQAMVELYWEIGRTIVDDEQDGATRAKYGESVLADLAARLTTEFGKGFDERNLRNMRQFYRAFPIRNALRAELSWTHYRLLMRVTKDTARLWYMKEAAEAGWSSRALERQIGSHYYERLLASKDRAPVIAEAERLVSSLAIPPTEAIKDPYVFEFLGLPTGHLLERDLENALIDNLQVFLLELGRGFSFVGRQYRVRTETADFFIDLVFYHYRLRCFVLIDLKTGPLVHQDIGQMDMYVRLFDDRVRSADDRPTVGLVLCSSKDETIVRYSVMNDSERLFASEYCLYLPTEAELQALLTREREAVLRRNAREGDT